MVGDGVIGMKMDFVVRKLNRLIIIIINDTD
jgi:hypothetical protein